MNARIVLAFCLPMLVAVPRVSSQTPPGTSTSTTTTTGRPAAAVPVSPVAAAWALYRKGRDYEYQGKTQSAMTAYGQAVTRSEQILATSPREMDAHVVRCFSLFRLGKYQDVLTYGRDALKLAFDPRLSQILGEASYMLGRSEDCIEYMKKYIETAGEDAEFAPNAYYYTAESYMRLRRYAHADIAFTTALAKAPSMARWWYRLGIACEAQAQYRRAYDAFVKSLSLNPRSEDAQAARDRVKARAGM